MNFDLGSDLYIDKTYSEVNKTLTKEIKRASINETIERALNGSTNTADEMGIQWKVYCTFNEVKLTHILLIQAIEQHIRTGECYSPTSIRITIEDDITNDDYLEFLVDDIKSKFMSYKMDLYNRMLFGGIYDR